MGRAATEAASDMAASDMAARTVAAPPPGAAPPASFLSFCLYFLREHRRVFAWLFVVGFGVACADALVAVFIGQIVGLVGQADRWAAWHERWLVLAALAAAIGLVRPLLIRLDLHLRNAILVPDVTARMCWISHWHVVRQSWSFFQSHSPGRLAHWVMQTPGALRESAEATLRAVWYLSMYGLASVALLAAADPLLAAPVIAWMAGYVMLLRRFVPRLRERADDNADRYSRLLSELADCYGNILTVKLFSVAATSEAGPVRNFVCGGRFSFHACMAFAKRSPKMTANCALAIAHSRGGIFHSFSARFKTRKSSFIAASSVGKWPLARTARRSLAFSASMALVVVRMRRTSARNP